MELYPLKLKPIFKHRIWGGRRLQKVFGKDLPPGEIIGESWELADLPDDKSEIINGELAGQTINDVVKQFGNKIFGSLEVKLPFPLLIKFLDANDILSVQVHPDAETCRRIGKGDPKTECWYIIAAEPDAYIYKGLKAGVNKEQFAKSIESKTTEQLLEKVYVQAGQCHFLPAGLAHTIGAGILIAEIQTPSDTTYRVYDWNRLDKDGKERQLHIDDALESINFNISSNNLPVTTIGRLVDSDFFKIDKGHQCQNCEVFISQGQMKVLIFLSGKGIFISNDAEVADFTAGDTVLVPAVYEGAISFAAESEYLKVTL